ncbi:alpha/beta hydrolase [Streptomyces akebiae]|uniref:Alpha/beta hydrolase n=1 Tax=Streptomyces akebiae TaxID=2865673 RepID=A0ABX8XL12_9ACTN|nr:alpha/beta hydrolase [Streptomyces akebiae]QYX76645.1 alpha/beta hydrolase [Streptomyces akebiae]
MPYAFDPEIAPWVAMLPEFPFTDLEGARRREAEMVAQLPAYEPSVPVQITDTTVAGEQDGPAVPVRIYTPEGRDGDLPGLLYIHGGGFVAGSIDVSHADATRIAAEVGAVVVAVDYRLAPEHPFPAGLEDCYAALTWTADHATELGIDRDRLGAAGESAGAGLTAAVTLLARDRGGPALRFQFLAVPDLDDRLETPSMRAFIDTPVWHRPNAELSWDYYLGGQGIRGGDGVSAYAAPARAEDLSGLPPAYVSVSEFDPLRDEGLNYAHRLIQAGVPTELHFFPGTFHGSMTLVPDAEVSRRMLAEQFDALRRGLGAGHGPVAQ